MRPLHRVLFVLAAFVAFQGVQACASETPDPGLNPQPLPPQEEQKDNVRDPEQAPNDPTVGAGGSTSSSGSSSGGGSPAADGDAGDGGGGDSGGDH